MNPDMQNSIEPAWLDEVRRAAAGVRRRVLRYTIDNNGGYLSQACSAADLLCTLYVRSMRLGPSIAPPVPPSFAGPPGADNPHAFTGAGYNGPRGPELDRFFFSPVHYALVLYSVLIQVGRLASDGLAHFNVDGSTVELIGAEHSPGHELTAGSLGQCISQAGGIALARKLRGEPGRCFVFMSDGEFQEGQTWEAMAALAQHRIDRIVVVVDANAQQCDGAMAGVGHIEPLAARLQAFGVRVVELDGHDPLALAAAAALPPDGRPTVIIARTDPCRGLPILQARAPKLHYVRFGSQAERDSYAVVLACLEAGGQA